MIDYSSFLSTLRETSLDRSKGESLLMDERRRVVNYDAMVDEICSLYRSGDNYSSSDCIALSQGSLLFIEFKNQKLSRIDSDRIRKKAFDTICLFTFLEDRMGWQKRDKKYVVLYDEDDIPSWSVYRSRLYSFGGKMERVELKFGLEKYRAFYSDILTLSAEDFFNSELYRDMEEIVL